MNYYSEECEDINDIDLLWGLIPAFSRLSLNDQEKPNQSCVTDWKKGNQLLISSQNETKNHVPVPRRKRSNKIVKHVPNVNPVVQSINNYCSLMSSPITVNPHILGIRNLAKFSSVFETINGALTYTHLAKNSAEYRNIKTMFESRRLIVKIIKEVHNPYLKKAFDMKRHFCYGNIQPQRMYHGTKKEHVDNICTYNFNWRLSGLETGHRYGRGVNFAKDPLFAAFFGEKRAKKVIIIADVLIKKKAPGTENLLVPPKGFDTTTGNKGRVFVKFYDDEFCPKYVIEFLQIRHK